MNRDHHFEEGNQIDEHTQSDERASRNLLNELPVKGEPRRQHTKGPPQGPGDEIPAPAAQQRVAAAGAALRSRVPADIAVSRLLPLLIPLAIL